MAFASPHGEMLLHFIILIAGVSALTWLITATSLKMRTSTAWRLAGANIAISVGVFLFTVREAVPGWVASEGADGLILLGLALFHDGIAHLLKAKAKKKDSLIRFAAPIAYLLGALIQIPGITRDNHLGILFSLSAGLGVADCCRTLWFGLSTKNIAMEPIAKAAIMAPFIVIFAAMAFRAWQLFWSHISGGVTAEQVPIGNSFLWACAVGVMLANIATSGAAIGRIILKLRDLSEFDPLTGVMNRRNIERQMTIEFGRRMRNNSNLGCVFIDLDDFKKINDRHGHETGDRALKNAANQMKTVLRGTDHLGRYGGEEFIALLPDTDAFGAQLVASRMLKAMQDRPLTLFDGSILPVTASLGVAILASSAEDSQSLIKRADEAMYVAKRRGKNRVEISHTDALALNP